jgi:DNA-binding MarR family transcriptional regulator
LLRQESSTRDNDGRYVEHVASIGPYRAGQVLGSAGSRTGFMLTILGDSFSRQIREVLARHELKPRQLRILDLLAARGPTSQRELAELMGIDHSVLVNLLNPLEATRLIRRERDATDRRRHLVSIATAGQRRLSQADQAFRDAENAFFAPLTAGDRDQLHTLLSQLREDSEPQNGSNC